MDFTGEFETHLTIRAADDADVVRLRAWAAPRGLKCTHIVLARGQSISQPMLTRHGGGELAEQRTAATELAQELHAAGFDVTRVKIEAAPWNSGVPQSDVEGKSHPRERYFEHHVKLLLEAGADIAPLTAIAQRHAAHVSRSALRQRDDGREERFVTQRCCRVGRATAHAALDQLVTALTSANYEIIDVEEEFVVYDSNVALDAGWIEP
jgi:hypothetical protein